MRDFILFLIFVVLLCGFGIELHRIGDILEERLPKIEQIKQGD